MKKWILPWVFLFGGSELSCDAVLSCSDGVKNQDETAPDCGGICGATCTAGTTCSEGSDCESDVCAKGVCEAPSCTDKVRNGSETDLDCGGSCTPCADTDRCATDADCQSGLCSMAHCYPNVIRTLTPARGERAGGTVVRITGVGFTDKPPAAVLFDGVPGSALSITNDTEIQVTTPSHAKAGLVEVRLSYPDGTSLKKPDAFRYYYGQMAFAANKHVLQLPPNGCDDIAAADLDGDGKDDLALVCNDRVDVLLSNGDGTFRGPTSSSLGISSQIGQVAVADFNNDKKPDLAITLRGANRVAVMYSNGDGSFDSPTNLGVPNLNEPIPLKVADFDHDGYADIAFAGQNIPPKLCVIRRDDRDKTVFRTPECYMLQGEIPTNITVADLDRNGAMDLVLSSYATSGLILLLYNNYNGIFTKIAGINTSCATGNVFAGDWNGDGQADLVAATERNCYKQIYFQGDGSGAFLPERVLATSPQHQAYEAARADFDNNGTDDVVMEGSYVNIATILLSQRGTDPSGVLSLPPLDVTPDICASVAAGDFDGDGRVDVALDCAPSGWLNLFMNRSQ